jgi:excisionase family DNA binding protein
MAEKYLKVEDAAERLSIAPFTMRKWLRQKRVEGVKMGGEWRVPESALSINALRSATTLTPLSWADSSASEEEINAAKAIVNGHESAKEQP